jgi:hypothetical protein
MSDVKTLVIERLFTLYGPPNHIAEEDQHAFAQEYYDSLTGFSDDVLRKTMNWIRDNHESTFWPTPGAIRKAAAPFLPVSTLNQPLGLDDANWEPKSEVSRANVRRMKEEFHRNMAAQSLGEVVKEIQMPDVSRPAMEAKNRRWRQAERVESAQQLAKRMTGDRDD